MMKAVQDHGLRTRMTPTERPLKGSRVNRSSALLTISGTMMLALALAGCTVPAETEPATAVPARSSVAPRTEQIVEVEVPKHMYFARSGDGQFELDPSTTVGWLVRGKSVLVIVYGSGSCPSIPATIDVRSADEVALVFPSLSTFTVCTMDYGPHSTAVALPSDVTGRPLTVTLDFSSDAGTSSARAFRFELD